MATVKQLEQLIVKEIGNWRFRRSVELCQELLLMVPASNLEGKDSRIVALFYYGEALRHLGEPQKAIAVFEQCYEEAGYGSQYAIRALDCLSYILAHQGQIGLAKEKLQQAIEQANLLNDSFCQAIVSAQQGDLAWFQEHLDEAITFYHRALAIFERLHVLQSQMETWTDIGLAHHYIGRFDKAIASYKEALKLARHLRHPSVGMLLSNLGECYQDLFAMEQARDYHKQALTAVQSLPVGTDILPGVLADIYRNLGVDLYHLGDIERGREYLGLALSTLQEEDDIDIYIQILCTFALVELEQGQLEAAWQQIQASLALAQKHEFRVHMAQAMYLSGLYYKQKQNVEAAQVAWQQSLFLAHETGQRLVLWQIHMALGDVTDNQALAKVHFHIAAEIIHQVAAPIADEVLRSKFLESSQVRQVLTAITV